MRLPFIQIDSDLVAHGAAEVGALAGCSPPQALGHITMLRAWAVSRATDAAPPDGLVTGDAAERRIEAAAQWTGERGALLQALLDSGQVRREPEGLRVLHLEPYVKAWEQNAKAKERMRTARERSANSRERGRNDGADSGERSAKFDGQTQTQTQTQKERSSASQDEAPASPGVTPPDKQPEGEELLDADDIAEPLPEAEERPPLVLQVQSGGKKPRALSKAEILYRSLQEARKARCEEAEVPFVDDGWSPARQNRDLGPLARLPEGSAEAEQLNAAWAEYLADETRAVMDVPWSLGWFLSARSTYVGRALKAGGGA